MYNLTLNELIEKIEVEEIEVEEIEITNIHEDEYYKINDVPSTQSLFLID